MKQVYIVGTNHDVQRGHGFYKKAAKEFRKYINNVCNQNQVKAIGEEMSQEALVYVGVEKSICEIVASELGLEHCLCDPDSVTRRDYGIRQENDIRQEGFILNWTIREIKRAILAESRKREEIWLSKLEAFHNDPILFVCGANHVKSFTKILRNKGLRSKVLSKDWAPNNMVYLNSQKNGAE